MLINPVHTIRLVQEPPKEVLQNDVESARRKLIREYNAGVSKQARNDAVGIGDRINTEGIKNVRARGAEETIIGLMLIFEEYRRMAASGDAGLGAEDFFSDFHKRAFLAITEMERDESYDFSLLAESFSLDEIGRLEGLIRKRRELTENGVEVFRDCIEVLKREKNASNEGGDAIDGIQRLLAQKREAQKNK